MKQTLYAILSSAMLGLGALHATPPSDAVDVIKHLEFLGYNASMDSKRIKALHPKHFNIFLKSFKGGILMTTYYGATPYGKSHREELLKEVNTLNRMAIAGRYYLDKEGDLVLEGYYPGAYDRQSFGVFLESFNEEKKSLGERLGRLEKFLK
jgi:hypothetical protein